MATQTSLATSICGLRAGIDAVSVNIDAVDRARRLIDAAERRVLLEHARSSGSG